jgi:hypothetical protein
MGEGVRDNIETWLVGEEKLDVAAMYDELARRYGPDSPTNYCSKLLAAVMDYETVVPLPPVSEDWPVGSGPAGF